MLAQDYKVPPATVTEPVSQLIGWLLWAVLLLGMVWLAKLGISLWRAHQDGEEFGVATSSILWNLCGAILITTSAAIATAMYGL